MKPAHRYSALWIGVGALSAYIAGCGSSGDTPPPPGGGDPPEPTMDHTSIALLDRFGNALTVDSTEPYSPRHTCGACHDIDTIANGYHFQQGRTDAVGMMHMSDDFNNDGRTWLLSDGMLGKW